MKILLIEDELHTRELIAATLLAHRYAIDAIADGVTGLEMATQWHYDLILLDILLPTLNGIEVCRRLRAQNCQTPILILTQKNSTEDIVAGLDAGADDYLGKSCDSLQLLARVRALLRRSGSVSASPVLTWGPLCLDPATARVTYDQTAIALRPKEYALLELFLRYPHRIFSRSAIIDHLWSMETPPVEGVITNLIKDLRQRLKAAGMTLDLIETVYGLGYRLKEAPAATEAKTRLEQDLARDDCPWETDWDGRSQQGTIKIQHITERFQASLPQRIAVLEAAVRSLQCGQLSLEQRQAAQIEAHKLAGGLGTFQSVQASELAQSIETLLAASLQQETMLMKQLPELLEALRQTLAQTSIKAPIA